VNCYAGGVLDVLGNQINGACTSWTTGFAPSAPAPQVVAVSPASGLTAVPINARVTVQFNEPVSAQTLGQVTLTASGGETVPLLRSLTSGNQTLVLLPAVTLRPTTLYTLTIAGVMDLSGHGMAAPVTSTFTTGAGADFAQPGVVSVDPANGLVNVPTNARVRVRFSKQVAVTSENLQVYPIYAGLAAKAAGAISVSADGLTATFTPVGGLRAATSYGVHLTGVTDLVGQGLANGSGTYTTFTTGVDAQTVAPAIVAVMPSNGSSGVPVNATVQVQLSGPISATGITPGVIRVTPGAGAAVNGTVSVGNNNTVLTFTPAGALTASTSYTIAVTGLTDFAGNPVAAFTSSFTTRASATPDITSPSVTSIAPVDGATGVAVTTAVIVTFDEPVNPLTVNVNTLQPRVNGIIVAGSYSVNGAIATFTPAASWPGNSQVVVWVHGGGVRDLAGNATGGAVTSFTTAATPDTTPPTVVSVTPMDGASGIGTSGQIVITFSESVNPNTLTACCVTGFYSNVSLFANGTRLNFSPSISGDNRTLTLRDFTLPSANSVSVVVTRGVTDLSGNGLVDFVSQFTTSAGFDTTHATVTSQRPGNGATGVARSSPLTLFVSEPLDPSTVAGALHV
jgi:methionine-rich copper-binding protein CopC